MKIKKTIAICIKLIIILIILPTSLSSVNMKVQANNQTFKPEVLSLNAPEIVNPMRGQYRWNNNERIPMPEPAMDAYGRYTWRELEPEEGKYDFSKLNAEIKRAKDSGKKYAFRVRTLRNFGSAEKGIAVPDYVKKYLWFSPSNGVSSDPSAGTSGTYIPDYNNQEFLQKLEVFVKKLGQEYNNNPAIAWVENGLYGQYGEFHISSRVYERDGKKVSPPGIETITEENAKKLVDFYTQAFPDTQIIMMFYRSFNGRVLKHALNTPHKIRIGWRLDCLGAELKDNVVTDTFPTFFNQPWWPEVANNWKYAPVITEYCQVLHKTDRDGKVIGALTDKNGVRTGKAFEWAARDVEKYHISLVSGGNIDEPWSLFNATEKTNAMRAAKLAGYRYTLNQITFPETISTNSTLSITSSWLNQGNAPTYENWNIMFQLRNPTTQKVVWEGKLNQNLKQLLPGTTPQNLTDSLQISVPQGEYEAALVITDPLSYRKPLKLAIKNQREDGSYRIGTIKAVGNSTVTPTPSSTPVEPTAIPCELKLQGDANCDKVINLVDFEVLRQEYSATLVGQASSTTSDFNNDSVVNLIDFQIFRNGYV